jgi:hypothetical protein
MRLRLNFIYRRLIGRHAASCRLESVSCMNTKRTSRAQDIEHLACANALNIT